MLKIHERILEVRELNFFAPDPSKFSEHVMKYLLRNSKGLNGFAHTGQSCWMAAIQFEALDKH